MKDYNYVLKYRCDDKTVTYRFNADINLTELKQNIMYFLRACQWSAEQTKFLEDEEDL